MNRQKTLVVVGGGAAGFFCAINAARFSSGLRVIILEKSGKVLSKVKVSGGGRCNVTHAFSSVEEMLHAYPRGKNFMRKTLHQFSPEGTIDWFGARGVLLKTEADGRMFPISNTSQTIIDCFMKEATNANVEIVYHTELQSIRYINQHFELHLKSNVPETIEADFLCLATGGFQKAEGFSFLQSLGIEIEQPVPSLFTFNIHDTSLHALMGVSVPTAVIRIPELRMEQSGPVLITHWGLSGPAVLKLSSYAARELHRLNYSFEAVVNWCPLYNESSVLDKLKSEKELHQSNIGGKNFLGLSSRLWEYLLKKAEISPETHWHQISSKRLAQLSKFLCGDRYNVNGKTTFKEEFVTSGGVKLSEIDPTTMQSKKYENLFFAGEVMDVDGITGGYNFQHAWSSGMIAAKAIAKSFSL